MSLGVNFAAIELSTYLDKWHYVRLGSLIFVAALIVTLVNRYLLRHEKTDVTIITDDAEIEEELALEEATVNSKSDEEKEPVPIVNPIKTEIETKKIEVEDKAQKTKVVDKPKVEDKKPSSTVAEKPFDIKKQEKVTDKAKKAKSEAKTNEAKSTESKATAVKQIEVKKSEVKSTEDKSVSAKAKPTEVKKVEVESKIEPKTTPQQPQSSQKPTTIKQSDKPVKIEKSVQSENKTQESKPDSKKILEDKIADINAHLGSLDDILDYAYAQKSKGDLTQAILAYQKALDRYKNDDYAPFIAIDLGNIYKEQASYTRFIKTYEEALKLPVVMRNADTRREFTKNLTYMRIVQSVLVKHRAITMPFSKIPRQYLQEVETEFKALQLNSSTARRQL